MVNYSVEFHAIIVTVLSTSDMTTDLQLTTLVWLQVWLTDQQQLWQQDTNLHLLFNFSSWYLYDNKTNKEYCNNYDVEFTYNSVLKGFSSMIVKLLYTHSSSVTFQQMLFSHNLLLDNILLFMYLCLNNFRRGKVLYSLSFTSQLLQYSLDKWHDYKFTIDYIGMVTSATNRSTTIMTTRH